MAKKKTKLQRSWERFWTVPPHIKYWYGYFYEHAKIKKNTILLESFHGKTINDSPLVCAQEIERLYPGKYKLYYATDRIKEHRQVIKDLGLNVELVDIMTMKYTQVLATVEYIISNASLPIYYVRKDGQHYLQTWHGTPLKTLGKKMREGIESMYNVQHNFMQSTHIMFPNEYTRNAMMEDYNLQKLYTGKVVMCGYPRNTVFFNDKGAAELRRKYDLEGKTVYAYMPTWRGVSNAKIDNTDYYNEVRSIFRKLDRSMKDDQVIYVNFHPIIGGSFSFDSYTHIKPFPADVSNYEFLNCTDALVTDYSSVFFDYSLTGKPIVLFMYDYDQYMADRGMYMDIKTLPFRKIYDKDEFCNCIAEGTCLEDSYSDGEYVNKYLPYDSPDCTEKLLQLFLEDKETLPVIDYSYNRGRDLKVYAPRNVLDRSDLRTLAKVADKKDSVVLMYRRWFKNGIGQMLFDDYNEDFDYVITTNTPPRTYLAQILAKAGVGRAKRHIAGNDRKRCFADLNVEKKYTVDFGWIEMGYNVDRSKIVRTDAEIIPIEQGELKIAWKPVEGLAFREMALLDRCYALIERRPLTKEELAGSYTTYSFKDAVESFKIYNKEYSIPAMIAEDADGQEVVVCYTDTGKERGISKVSKSAEKKYRSFVPSTGIFSLPKDYERANFKRIYNSPDKYIRDTADSFNTELTETKMAFVPVLVTDDNLNILKVRVSTFDRAITYISDSALLRGYRFDEKGLVVKAFMPKWSADSVTGGMMILDSITESQSIPMKATAVDTKGGCNVTISLDYSGVQFIPLRWHFRIAVRVGDEEYYHRISCKNIPLAASLKVRNVQSDLGNGFILYPYLGVNNIFKLTYREITEYDTAAIRRREMAAMVAYAFARPVLSRKKYYMIYEKFSRTAQDNAFFFFKYCMEELPEQEKKKFMYVIDKSSVDYQYVKPYEPRVVDFMSIKHMVYAMAADLVISTDSTPHFYAWQSKPSFVNDRIHDKDVLFLQHGVTALKRVDHLFGKKGTSPMKYFVTTSQIEQKIVVNEFGYTQQEAPITGFTRWDALQDKRDRRDKFILVMPTWRVWLEDVTEETFLESDYYYRYHELLTGEKFNKLLDDNDLRVVMYLHPKFAQYIESFRSSLSDRIELISFGQEPLNELMMRCYMLITDYSSVCWDVLFMDKPVVFYQFDSEKYLQAHGSYIDLETELPSPRATDYESLMKEVEYYVANDFEIQDEYERMIGRFLAYRDNNNCERTYQFLMRAEELGI
ncbi:MAG: CDP-glycerol--poly(glycerophosphate) glycerophosphotransferase [Clostridiales bacterium]|nr:CDP-glycerol--poly(glycerophosphate) glycerophosphotransferase [Clostridiales bacterium]